MKNTVVQVDLHGFRSGEAFRYLEWLMRTLPSWVQEVEVIHGYRSGNVLQRIVRQEFHSSRIVSRISGWNPGETILVLPA